MAIIFIVLVIANWVLYHKLFDVMYLNLGAGLFKEFAACVFMAGIEMALFGVVGPYLIALLIAVIVISSIRKYIKKKQGEKPILPNED